MIINNRGGEFLLEIDKLHKSNLKNINLSGANLEGADFYNSNLTWGDLTGTNLSYTDFTKANLHCADLSYADLGCARLRDANLSNTRFIGANLKYADLRDVKIKDTDFRNADLTGANLTGARYQGKTVAKFKFFYKPYKYNAVVFIDTRGNAYVQLEWRLSRVGEWQADFWNNTEEFPNDGSDASNNRMRAFELCLGWIKGELK